MTVLLDAVGRRRSPAIPAGLPRRATAAQQGHALSRRPADRRGGRGRDATTADDRHGWRVRAMIVVLWRSGLRIQDALALGEHDVDHRRGSARPQRQGRAPTRGRHGRVVPGAAPTVAARTGRAAGRAADSASSTGPPTAGPGQASAPAANPHDRASSGADVGATRAPTLAPAREVELIADAGAPPESDPGPACGSPEDRIDVEGQVVRILSEPVCLG